MTRQGGQTERERVRRHLRVESVSLLGAVARLSPVGLHRYSADFLRAAEAVAPPDRPFSPVTLYLACRTIELALKAFLSAQGFSLRTLASAPLGHHIDAL